MFSNVINFFQRRSIKYRLVGDYRKSTNDKEECRAFLIKHARLICKYHSFSTFKEFSLNYRIIFDRSNRSKIIHDYKKYVLTKTKFHKSNLAMSYNMIKTVHVDLNLETEILQFMSDQLNYTRKVDLGLHKAMLLDYVKTNYLTNLPR